MMNIGEFARLGGVSTRMLRHYDALGLLVPTHVDAYTSRRWYDVAQLTALNQLIALKGLGFSLDEVGTLLHEGIAPAELHGMLRLREAELERQVRHNRHTLDRVQARLRLIEQETQMTVETKHVEPLTIAALTASAADASRERTGAVVQTLFAQVIDRLEAVGGDRTTPIACYRPTIHSTPAPGTITNPPPDTGAITNPPPDTGAITNPPPDTGAITNPPPDVSFTGTRQCTSTTTSPDAEVPAEATVQVTAGYALSGDPVPGLSNSVLPATDVAAVIHHGPMNTISTAYQELARWAESTGRSPSKSAWREHYLEANGDDQTNWIVEVQLELD